MRLLEHGDPASALRNTTLIAAGLFLVAAWWLAGHFALRHGRPSQRSAPSTPSSPAPSAASRSGAVTEYYTSGKPVRDIAQASKTGAGHQHHRRPLGRHDLHARADSPHRRRHLRLLLGRGPLRHRHRRGRHAGDRRRHDDGGRLRPDCRQRRRHLRNERPRPRGPEDHRRPRRPRQHHRRHRQGVRHRLGGPHRPGPLQRLCHRGGAAGRSAPARHPQPDGGHRHVHRRHPALRHGLAHDDRGRPRRAGHGGGGAPPVPGDSRPHGRHRQARQRALRGHLHHARRCGK